MDLFVPILVAVLGNAAVLAVLGFLARSIWSQILTRDIRKFETELKADADAKLEALRSELRAKADAQLEAIKGAYVRDLETHKVRLKKSEFLFEREFAAACEFMAVRQDLLPEGPNMDFSEACDAIARDFHKVSGRLRGFLVKHGAILTEEERSLFDRASWLSGQGQYEIAEQDGNVSSQMNTEAGAVYENMQKLEQSLLNRVRAQGSTQ